MLNRITHKQNLYPEIRQQLIDDLTSADKSSKTTAAKPNTKENN